MKSKLIHTDENGQRTFAVIMDVDDEAIDCLTQFAEKQTLSASQFTAIGAFSKADLGYFDFKIKDYKKNPVREQAEVLSLVGDISISYGKHLVHAHAVIGLSDSSTKGGHLLKGYVNPTLEVMLTESPAHLLRKYDEYSGLNLIDLERTDKEEYSHKKE